MLRGLTARRRERERRQELRRLAAAVGGDGGGAAAERLRQLAYGERGRLRHVLQQVRPPSPPPREHGYWVGPALPAHPHTLPILVLCPLPAASRPPLCSHAARPRLCSYAARPPLCSRAARPRLCSRAARSRLCSNTAGPSSCRGPCAGADVEQAGPAIAVAGRLAVQVAAAGAAGGPRAAASAARPRTIWDAVRCGTGRRDRIVAIAIAAATAATAGRPRPAAAERRRGRVAAVARGAARAPRRHAVGPCLLPPPRACAVASAVRGAAATCGAADQGGARTVQRPHRAARQARAPAP